MEIKISTERVNMASIQLLDLSRVMRRSREEIEDVQRQLRALTELDECKRALRKQEEALSLLTAQLVNMSSALREITSTYAAVEAQNIERLEEQLPASRVAGEVVVYGVSDSLHQSIYDILYH